MTQSSFARRGIAGHDGIYKQCIQRGVIVELFRTADEDHEVATFYDEIKAAGAVKDNPYFWLQYSIARWKLRERELAESYIATARLIGKTIRGFSPFHISHFEATMRLEAQIEGLASRPLVEDVVFSLNVIKEELEDDRTGDYSIRLINTTAPLLRTLQKSGTTAHRNQVNREIADLRRRLPNSWVAEEYSDEVRQAESLLNSAWSNR